MERRELNGKPFDGLDFSVFSRMTYGHYTFMQVRDGKVRGLGLHLERLARGTMELLGCALDQDTVRAFVRRAVDGVESASVRINVFPSDMGWYADPHQPESLPVKPDVLVTVGAPWSRPSGPLRVRTACHERFLPGVKHGGIALALMKHAREARQDGWDDVLYVDREGRIEEGGVWNIGFLEGDAVIWPSAPALPGVAMLLIQRGLAGSGIRSELRDVKKEDITRFRGAFLTNTVAIARAISRIDEVSFAVDEAMIATLRACHEGNPGEVI